MPPRVIRAQMHLLRARRLLRSGQSVNLRLRLAAAIESCEAAGSLLMIPFADVVADQAIAELTLLAATDSITSWDARGRAFARAVEFTSPERRALLVAVYRILRFLGSEAGVLYTDRYAGSSQKSRSRVPHKVVGNRTGFRAPLSH
jgi:hypothetical protein